MFRLRNVPSVIRMNLPHNKLLSIVNPKLDVMDNE